MQEVGLRAKTKHPLLAASFGPAVCFLVVVGCRIVLFNAELGSYNTHPVTGLLLVPVVMVVACAASFLVRMALGRLFDLNQTFLGGVGFGVWLTTPIAAYLTDYWWAITVFSSIFLPYALGIGPRRCRLGRQPPGM